MYDVIIVGGGPAGLSAALILGRSRRKVLLVDAGRPRNWSAVRFSNYLGFDGRSPGDLLTRGREEIVRYAVERLEDRVTSAKALERGFEIRTESGQAATSRKLLLATGVYDNLPQIAGVPDCFGISVHHCPYCDAFEYCDQHIFAVGKDAAKAAGLGLSLRTWSSRITVLTNGEHLADDDRQKLQRCGVEWREEPVARVLHDEGRLQAIELATGLRLEGEALFFNTDRRQQSGLAVMLGLSFDEEATANTSEKQRSRIPGLFLAGDIDGDVQFVIVAAAEGATAAVAINRELQDDDRCV